MSKNIYILASSLLSSLDENLMIENLNKFISANISPSRLYISFCGPDKIASLLKDNVLVGRGFNFSNLNGNEVYFIFSRNDFIKASHLVFSIIDRFRKKMKIYRPFFDNELLYQVVESYINIDDTIFLSPDRNEYVLLKESPSFRESFFKLDWIREENSLDKEKKYLVYDIMDENIFIDREFLYFKKDNNFYKIKKYRVSLV